MSQRTYELTNNLIDAGGKLTRLAWNLLKGFGLFAVSVVALWVVALVSGSEGLKAVTGVAVAVLVAAFLVLARFFAIVAAVAFNVPGGVARRLVRGAASIVSAALFFAVIFTLLPVDRHLGMVPLVLVLLSILVLTNAWLFNRRVISILATILLLGTMMFLLMPGRFQRGLRTMKQAEGPRRVEVTLDKVESGEVQFFLSDGAPNLWFSVDASGRKLEWWDSPGAHPVFQAELRPASPEAVEEFMRFLEGERDRLAAEDAARRLAVEDERKRAEEERRRNEVAAAQHKAQARRERLFNLGEASSPAAVVIALGGRIDSSLSESVARQAGGTPSFFKPAFVSEGLFDEVHAGQTERLRRLGLSRMPDRLILGVAKVTIGSGTRASMVRAEATIDLRVIYAGQNFRTQSTRGLGIAARFTDEEATRAALEQAADEAYGKVLSR